jgi:hypothetical protein
LTRASIQKVQAGDGLPGQPGNDESDAAIQLENRSSAAWLRIADEFGIAPKLFLSLFG